MVCDLQPHEGTMLRYMTVLGIVATILAGATTAQAATDAQARQPQNQQQPAPRPAPEPVPRKTSIHAVAGFGTPVGEIGIEAVHRFESNFEVAAGIGAGANALEAAAKGSPIGNPVQWAMMPRLRLGGARSALTMGAGISGGNYAVIRGCGLGQSLEQDGGCAGSSVLAVGYVLWSNLEIGGEVWNPTGLSFRYFVGYGHVLTPGALHCVNSLPPCTNPPSEGQDLPYIGLGIGYAF